MSARIVIRGRGANGASDAMRELAKRLQQLPPKFNDAVVRGLQSAAYRGIGEVVRSIDTTTPHAPNDTGTLRQSVRAAMMVDGAVLRVEAPHAGPMEHGTRPFTPPRAPLAEWAMRKGIAKTEEEAERIATAVQHKFKLRGIAPRHYFRRAMKVIRGKIITEEVNRELARIRA